MKDKELRQDQELTKHFTSYREEDPLLSVPEVRTLLSNRAMLPTNEPLTIGTIIMTTLEALGLAVLSLWIFAYPTKHTTPIRPKTVTEAHSATTTSAEHDIFTPPQPAEDKQLVTAPLLHANEPISPPPSGFKTDAFDPIEPTAEELKALGIQTMSDGQVQYYIQGPGKKAHIFFLSHNTSGVGDLTTDTIHSSFSIPNFGPTIITNGDGHFRFYQESKEDGHSSSVTYSDHIDTSGFYITEQFLNSPPKSGLEFLGFVTVQTITDHDKRSDTIKIQIGKDLPNFPKPKPRLDAYSKEIESAMLKFGEYYAGKAPLPQTVALPPHVSVQVDTLMRKDMLEQLHHMYNNGYTLRALKVFQNLNKLTPVRITAGNGDKYIFWYSQSPEFSAIVSKHNNARPATSTITGEALLVKGATLNVVSETPIQSSLAISIRDLTGRIVRSESFPPMKKGAVEVSLAGLEQGMYIADVTSGNKHSSSRIWVDKSHPQNTSVDANANEGLSPLANQTNAIEQSVGMLTLPPTALGRIGISEDSATASFYTDFNGHQNSLHVLRTWGVIAYNPERIPSQVTPQPFEPKFVTDRIGRKRIYTSDSTFRQTEEAKEYSDINKLIPVLLASHNSRSSDSTDLIFWYRPTRQFIALLPDSVRALYAAEGVKQISIPSSKPVQLMSIFPNPTQGEITVHLLSSASNPVSITVRNLLGKEVLASIPLSGTADRQLSLRALEEGVYLLDLQYANGEHSFGRVVIAR